MLSRHTRDTIRIGRALGYSQHLPHPGTFEPLRETPICEISLRVMSRACLGKSLHFMTMC